MILGLCDCMLIIRRTRSLRIEHRCQCEVRSSKLPSSHLQHTGIREWPKVRRASSNWIEIGSKSAHRRIQIGQLMTSSVGEEFHHHPDRQTNGRTDRRTDRQRKRRKLMVHSFCVYVIDAL